MLGWLRRKPPSWSDVPDPNLRLAILQATWSEGLLAPFDRDAFYRDVLKEPWDHQRHGYSVDERTREAILATTPPAAVLAKVQKIEWGGGHDVQHLIYQFWDGEDGFFDVADLTGISVCENLRVLDLGAARITDVGPLRRLRRLESFTLYFGGYFAVLEGDHVKLGTGDPDGNIRDLRPLLELPALAHLDIGGWFQNDARNHGVLAALKKRGVNLRTPEDARQQILADARDRRRKDDIALGLAAFKDKQHAEVVSRLGPHESFLAPSERLKLQYSRKQLGKA